MDSGSRVRAVGNSGRPVIVAGRHDEGRARSRRRPALRLCVSCRGNHLPGRNSGDVCGPCEQALSGRQRLADPDARDDLATWAWDTEPMRSALARLDFRAVLVIYRTAARLSRRELAQRTGLSESAIWYWEAGERQGIYDIRQLLQFADAVKAPRPALLPVILGQPTAPSDFLTVLAAATPSAGGADRG
ncbi:MAG: helix-turn-helix domain-containing protein [Trebonia sp.]